MPNPKELAREALSQMFGKSEIELKEESGLIGFSVDIQPADMDEIKRGEGPIRDWGAELVAWQALQVVERHNAATGLDAGLAQRARRYFDAGDWKGGLRYVIAYRDQLEKNAGIEAKRAFGRLVREVKETMNGRIAGRLMAGKTEGGWFYGAAKAELTAPVIGGTRPIIPPVMGFHVCSGMPSLKIACDDALGHAIGMIAPDVEANYRRYPPLSEVLAMIRKDLEKAGMETA